MINIPKAELIDRTKLIVDETNPNEMNDNDFDALKEVISKYGFIIPIITNKEYKIADGYHRWKAARDLDIKEVPVIALDVDEVDRRILRQVLNKLKGTHREDFDMKEFKFLDDNNAIVELINLLPSQNKNIKELLDLINQKEAKDEEFDPEQARKEAEANCKVKLGDIYQLGEHRLLCGDATIEKDYNTLIENNNIDLILTDPPYGIGYEYNQYKDEKGEEYLRFSDSWFNIAKTKSKLIILFTGWTYNKFWENKDPYDKFYWIARNKQSGGKNSNWRRTEPIFIWGRFKNKLVDDYLDIIVERQKVEGVELRNLHTCPKPIKLFSELIKSVNQGDKVLDLFGGSGTTLIVAEKLKRKCFMMELDPIYCQVIIDRWEDYTGNKATKIDL